MSCFTLANAWNPTSVNKEQRATSSVAKRGQCCDRDDRVASVRCPQPERQR